MSEFKEEKELLEKKQMSVDEEIRTLKEKLEKRDKTVTDQNLRISKFKEERRLLKKKLMTADEEIRTLKEKLEKRDKTMTEQNLRISKVEKEKRLLQKKRKKAEGKIRTLEENLETGEKTVAEHTFQLSTFKEEKELLEKKKMSVDEEIRTLKEKLEKRQQTVTEQNLNISKVSENNSKLQEEIQKLQEENKIVKDRLALEQETSSSLQESLQKKTLEKDETLKRETTNVEKELLKIQDDTEQTRSSIIKMLEEEKSFCESKMDQAKKSLSKEELSNKDLATQMKEAHSQVLKLEREKNEAVDEKQKLYGELSVEEKECDRLESCASELKSSIKETQHLHEMLRNESKQLEGLLIEAEKKEQYMKTSPTKNRIDNRLKSTYEEVDQLEAEMSEAKNNLFETETRLSKVETSIKEMKDTRIGLMKKENTKDEELRKQRDVIAEQHSQFSTAEAVIKERQLQIKFYEERLNTIEARLRNECNTSNDIQSSMKSALLLLLDVRRQNFELRRENGDLTENMEINERKTEELREELTKFEKHVKKLTEQQATFTQALNEEEPIVTDLNSMREDLVAKTNETMENFTRERNSVEQEQLQLQQRLNQQKQLLWTTEEKLKLAKSAVVDLQSKKDNLEKQQQQLEEKLAILEKNEREARELLQETNLMIKDFTNKKKMLLEKQRQLEEIIQYHREELDEKDSKIRELEDKVAQIEAENRQLNTDLDAARAKSDHQQQLLKQAMSEKEKFIEELTKCKNEQKRLSEELSSQEENITRLNSRLNETKKEMENLTTQNEQFRKIKQTLQESEAREKDRSEKLQTSIQQASTLTDELKKHNIMLQYDRDHSLTALKTERNKTRKLHEFISEALPALGMLNHLIDFFKTEKTKMENISVDQMETELCSSDVTEKEEERNEMGGTHVADIISRKDEINEIGEELKLKNQLRIEKKKERVAICEEEKKDFEEEFADHQENIETYTTIVKKQKEELEKIEVESEHKLETLEKQYQDNESRVEEEKEELEKQRESLNTNEGKMKERDQEKKYFQKWRTKMSDEEYLSVNNMTKEVTAVMIPSIDRDVKQIDDDIILLTKTQSRLATTLLETQTRKEKIEDAMKKIECETEEVEELLEQKKIEVERNKSYLKFLNTLTSDKAQSITAAENEIKSEHDKLEDKMKQEKDLRWILNNAKTIASVMIKKNAFLEESITRLFENIRIATGKIIVAKELLPTDIHDQDLTGVWRHPDELRATAVISEEGGRLRIHGTDISLDIPEGAVEKQCVVTMKVISQCLDPGNGPVSFSTNSTLIVELLPNNLELKNDVKLRIPHCLTLKQGFNINESAEALISHHEEGNQPKWELFPDVKCELQENVCTLYLRKFCWVTYKVKDEIVRGKRLKIFTAGRQRLLTDRESDIEVGFFPDMPGKGEILRLNKHLKIGQCKPFLFRKKEDEAPLQIQLKQITPRVWENNTTFGDTQEISYESISTDTEKSCPFNLRYKLDDVPREIPFCIFDVAQQDERIKITIRPEVYDDDNEETDIDDTDVED